MMFSMGASVGILDFVRRTQGHRVGKYLGCSPWSGSLLVEGDSVGVCMAISSLVEGELVVVEK
jgi:hypothetical protein